MTTKKRSRNRKSKRRMRGGANGQEILPGENENNFNGNDPKSVMNINRIEWIEALNGALIALHQAQQHAANVHMPQNVEPPQFAQAAQQIAVVAQAALQVANAAQEAQAQLAAAQAAINEAENYV